jgi:CheY-like chemotaxis protein
VKKRLLHVLWIEDSIDDIELFKIALTQSGLRLDLEIKTDGETAMDFLLSLRTAPGQKPDLILLDLNLPIKNGGEVLVEIKRTEHLKGIPVAILTTTNAESEIRECYRAGASCFLVKPGSLEQLLRLIQAFCAFWEMVEFPAD